MFLIPVAYPENTPDHKKLMRCETHRWIVTQRNIHWCGGHRMRITTHITPFEWIQWKLGLLK